MSPQHRTRNPSLPTPAPAFNPPDPNPAPRRRAGGPSALSRDRGLANAAPSHPRGDPGDAQGGGVSQPVTRALWGPSRPGTEPPPTPSGRESLTYPAFAQWVIGRPNHTRRRWVLTGITDQHTAAAHIGLPDQFRTPVIGCTRPATLEIPAVEPCRPRRRIRSPV